MATKRFRAGAWQYTIRRAGLLPKPIYYSDVDESAGDEWARRIEALLDRGIVPDEFFEKKAVKQTVRDAIRRYVKAQHISPDDAERLVIIDRSLPADFQLADVSFVWATEWVTQMKREANLAPSTIRKHVGALARCMDWVTAHGEMPANPLRMLPKGYATYTPDDASAVLQTDGRVKSDMERDRRFEGDEEINIRRIMAGAKPEGRQRPFELRHSESLQLIFDMALETAMRMREMFTLTVSQVDLARRTIFLDKTKNGDRRQVPISSVLMKLLTEAVQGKRPDDYLFPWWDGDVTRRALERVTAQLSRQFARIFDAAGCEDLHFHDLRHEATSRLFERTHLSDMEIAKITGHKSMSMLRRYSNLRGSDLAARMW